MVGIAKKACKNSIKRVKEAYLDALKKRNVQANEKMAIDYCNRFHVFPLNEEEKEEISAYWGQYGI